MKRCPQIFLIALAFLGITARAFSYPADVTDISGTKYFPALKEALSKAEKSIYVAMFTIESTLARPDAKPNQLIDTLIAAKNRGVEVQVILDQNVDFVHMHPGLSDGRVSRFLREESQIKSTRAYRRLKDAGVKVNYDEPARYTHAKCIIIDKKIVILGSTNWTEASFDNNIETSVLINSPQLAEEILAYLKTIKIDTKIDEYLDTIGPSVPIAWEFMENPDLAAGMVKSQDERAFDIYLYLLWKYEKNRDSPLSLKSGSESAGTVPVLTLFYDDLAKYLGIYEGWTITDYRRQIIKVFKKLEQRYKLVKFEPRYAKEATITLVHLGTVPLKSSEIAMSGTVPLPEDYFNFGWNRRLSLRAKFCYLINLANTDVSDVKPFWSKSVSTITKQFGDVGQDVVSKGMGELRRENLLEVRYDELSGKPYDERRPKMYKILKLYDPKVREAQIKAIEEKYGKEAFAKARKYSEIVFEENNPAVIEDIILKTKQYGEQEIKRVFDIVSQKNIDNPKRNYLYFTRILGRTEGEEP